MARKPKNRVITISEITQNNINEVIKFIYDINIEDTTLAEATGRTPIILIVNSEGGDVYSGLGLIEAIKNSKTPVYTVCHGQAQSMGLLIFLVGDKRFIGKYSTLMYHEIEWDVNTQSPKKYHKQEVDEAERLQKLYDNIVIEYTELTQKQLNKIKDTSTYWYLTPEEAIKFKMVDEILEDNLAF